MACLLGHRAACFEATHATLEAPLASTAEQASRPANAYALSGCRARPVSSPEIARYEGRYEYWDGATELAWDVHDVSARHEEPCGRLVELVKDIGKVRGRPISLYGTADLQERKSDGTRVQAARADQLIYLDCPAAPPQVIVVGDYPLPDVVFEVDLTTDVRDRKLAVYASWGVRELWVEVPDASMPSKRKRPGLTIHVLKDGEYGQRAESEAFPTLSAEEIRRALNEPWTSSFTVATMRRVGEAMGALTGTGPDNDPFLAVERRMSRDAGLREGEVRGLERGREEGRREGLRRERLSTVESLLAARGIHVGGQLGDEADRIAAMPRGDMIKAALHCSDLGDFRRRLSAV